MSTKQSADNSPSGPTEPASVSGSEGGSPPSGAQAHQGSPTGLSEVSDSVSLTAGLGDAYEGFDPSVHAVGADGKPLLKKGGGLARKRGRKVGDTGAPAQAQPAATVNPQNSDVAKTPTMSSQQAAVMIVASTTMVCKGVFGDDAWRIQDKAEFLEHVQGVKAYLDATGGLDMSPGWALVGHAIAYAGPRLESPPTQSRIQKIAGWIKGKFSGKKAE